jgi:hypothetical protein
MADDGAFLESKGAYLKKEIESKDIRRIKGSSRDYTYGIRTSAESIMDRVKRRNN